MQCGNIEIAFISLNCHNKNLFAAGVPLEVVSKQCDAMEELLTQYDVKSVLSMHPSFRTLVDGLSGPRPPLLTWPDNCTADANQAFRNIWKSFARFQLAFYYGDLPLAEQMRKDFVRSAAPPNHYVTTSGGLFFSCLTATGMYRLTKKWKHKRCARSALKQAEKILANGRGINLLPK